MLNQKLTDMKRWFCSFFTLGICFMLITQSFSQSNDEWSQFRGPNCSGIASGSASPPIEFGENNNLLWKIKFPEGSSSPVVWDSKVFLTGFIKEKEALLTICLDSESGKIMWQDTIYPEIIENYHPISSPAQATIAVDESGIYSYFASYGIRCFDHSGSIKWDNPMPLNGTSRYGNPGSPVLSDDKVFLFRGYGGEKVRCLLALNKENGDTIWNTFIQSETPFRNDNAASYSTPVIYENQIILHRVGGVASYDLTSGSPIWWFPVQTNGNTTPVVYDNHLFIGAWNHLSEEDRRGEYILYDTYEKALTKFDANGDSLIIKDEIPEDLLICSRPELEQEYEQDKWLPLKRYFEYVLDKNKDGFADKNEWLATYQLFQAYMQNLGTFALPLNLNGEVKNSDILWMNFEKNPEVPSPLVYNNEVYIIKNGGWLTCIDSKNGELYYQEKIGAPGAYISSPIVANDNIYIASNNASVKVIKAGRKPIVLSETKFAGKITATPAVIKNKLYIRTSSYVYAFANHE